MESQRFFQRLRVEEDLHFIGIDGLSRRRLAGMAVIPGSMVCVVQPAVGRAMVMWRRGRPSMGVNNNSRKMGGKAKGIYL